MRNFLKLAPVAVAFLCTFWIASLAYAVQPQADGAASPQSRGAATFHTSCERCHSILGVGGDRAPDLGKIGAKWKPEKIRKQVLKGGHGMPPFDGVLSGEQIDDLIAFLSECRGKGTPNCRQWMPAQ